MREKRWLYFALGVTTVISIGAVTNQLVPRAPAGLALSDQGIHFPDGSVQATAAPADPRRSFYMTKGNYNGVLSFVFPPPCADGYHFASFFEILAVSNLRYNTDLGRGLRDSGEGPPTQHAWIRTGGGD